MKAHASSQSQPDARVTFAHPMPYQISRADTGQFVLTDSATDTVVIDDDLAQGFARLEQAVAGKPAVAPTATSNEPAPASSAFAFRGGPRYTPILLAVVLPFAWLAVLYFALANLLAETALDRRAAQDSEAKIEALEQDLQRLRSELAAPSKRAKPKPSQPKPKASVSAAAPSPPASDDPS